VRIACLDPPETRKSRKKARARLTFPPPCQARRGARGVESPTDRAPRPLALHAGSPPFPTPPSPSPVSE
jgi:hypothetical protein